MTRNPLNISSEARAKNATRAERRAEAGYPAFSLGVSFLLGAISLGWVLWQRISGNAYLNTHVQSFNSVTSFYPGLQSSSYGIQFPGLTTLVVGSALTYQSGNPLLGLLSSWTLWLSSPVNVQALPAIIDFNIPLTMNLGCSVQGAAGNDNAGYSLAGVGDVNGDGKSDFLVGARYASPAGRNVAGAAYLIYGGANLPTFIDLGSFTQALGVVMQGGAANDYAGSSVAAAGDVNGDGKSDFLVGANAASPAGRSHAGAAYLIYGGANLPAVIDLGSLTQALGVVMQGGAAGDQAGYSVAGAGDVNGDGKSDFLVGTYWASLAGRMYAGAAYLIYGGTNLPAVIDLGSLTQTLGVAMQGGAASDLAGTSVAGAGDVNGDGNSDFLVGAYGASPAGRSQAGAAYLIYGGTNLPSIINLGNLTQALGVVMQGGAMGDEAGTSVAAVGDVNGDGKSDFLVGAYAASPAGRGAAGAAYLIYGGANLPSVIDLGSLTQALGVVIQGGAASDLAGTSVAAAGDVNGDGKSDFLVGAWYASPGGRFHAGAAYLIYGGANLPAVINLGNLTQALGVVMQGGAVGDQAGISVAAAGDVNGDGGQDMLIGANLASSAGRSHAGEAYVVYGPPRSTLSSVIVPTTSSLSTARTTTSTASAPTGPTPTSKQMFASTSTNAGATLVTTTGKLSTQLPGTSLAATQSGSTLQTTSGSAGASSVTPMSATISGFSLSAATGSTVLSFSKSSSTMPLVPTIPTSTSPATNLTPIIAGAVGGGVGLAACLGAIGFYACRKKRAKKSESKPGNENEIATTLRSVQNSSANMSHEYGAAPVSGNVDSGAVALGSNRMNEYASFRSPGEAASLARTSQYGAVNSAATASPANLYGPAPATDQAPQQSNYSTPHSDTSTHANYTGIDEMKKTEIEYDRPVNLGIGI